MLDSTGATAELTDYYPYGAVVYETTTSSVDNNYKYTGKELDTETALQYYGARYLDNSLGRFTSVDLATLVLANTAQVKALTGTTLKDFLTDPQLLNGYSYTRNNPLLFVDPDGNAGQNFNPWAAMLQGQRQIAQFMQSAADHAWSQGSLLGYSSGLVAGALGGVANSTAELLDPGTKPVTRMLAFGSLALDVASGGEGKLVKGGVEETLTFGSRPVRNFLTRDFSAATIDEKYAKHVIKQEEFSSITREEFGQLIDKVWHGLGNILEKVRPNGDVLRYDMSRNIFSSMSKEGELRTFFQPQKGLDYWFRQ